jgi:5-methylcytosine-specific restriction protein A
VTAKHGLCKLHLIAKNKRVNEARTQTTTELGYGWKWRKAREVFLSMHPLCECAECRALGRILPASVVDHRTPHRGDITLFWDMSNWQALSKSCHDRKTARVDGGFGNRRKTA